jgi:membrane-bound lytic murein transglycosylase D
MSFKQISDLLEVPVSTANIEPFLQVGRDSFYGDENHYLRLPKEKIAVFA